MRDVSSFRLMISGIPPAKRPSRVGQPALRAIVGAGIPVLVLLLLQAGGEGVTSLLRYDRAPIEDGQVWRLVTAHVVHLGWGHAVLNAAALALIIVGFGPLLRGSQWIVVVLVSALAVDAGLWFLHPIVDWYAGLSGVLHGLVAAAGIAMWRATPRPAAVILCLLAGKLLWEFTVGPLPLTGKTTGANVIVQAHLWGAAGGFLGALFVTRRHPADSPV